MFRLLAVLSLVFAAATLLPTAAAADEATGTIVVDDDNVQCPDAEISTIQKAVDKAAKKNSDRVAENDVNLVRVCPGLYAEQVSVREPLTVRGDAEAVKALDCFASTLTPDPETQAIVAAPADAPTKIFELQADNIELQGFVLRGQTGPATSAAVITDALHSGYWVHGNLIMGSTVAAFFRSSGALASSFDNNCLRDNGWGVANHWLRLVNAQIHHNSTFRIANFAYEQTNYCPERFDTPPPVPLPCPESRVAMDRVAFKQNVSTEDDNAFRLASSTSTTLFENIVTDARIGIRLVGANEDLDIIDNKLHVRPNPLRPESPSVGVARQSNPPVPPNPEALIKGNTITGTGAGAGIGMGANGLQNSEILDNIITGMNAQGIALLAGNTNNLVRGNIVTNNGTDGIQAGVGATGNTFEANTMLGNGWIAGVDARDQNTALPLNVWHANVCATDSPMGTICGIP